MTRLLALSLLAPAACYAAPSPKQEIGPAIGAALPGFALPDAAGNLHRSAQLLGPKGAVLLFLRSASWCPNCKAQLVTIERYKAQFDELGVGLAAISYDSPEVLRNAAARHRISFPLLSDRDSRLIRQLNLLDVSVPAGHAYAGIPYPCFLVIDPAGVIRGKYFEDDHRLRDSFTDILLYQFGVLPSGRQFRVEEAHASVTATASRSVLIQGQRAGLSLAVELPQGILALASGAAAPGALQWSLGKSRHFADLQTHYPAAGQATIAGAGTQPVYKGRFLLRATLTLRPGVALDPFLDGDGNLTVDTTLTYQPCQGPRCLDTRELPIRWTFQFTPFPADSASR